jgi:hypothetical protein
MKQNDNLTGQVVAGWTFVRMDHAAGLTKWWVCRHKCGHERLLRKSHLRNHAGMKLCPVCSNNPLAVEKKEYQVRKKKEGGTSVELANALRQKNKADKAPVAPVVEEPKKRIVVRKFTDREIGKMQAYAYAKGYQARGWL